jgi:UDP-N-acetylglucosamine transferase subunit ALG13
MIFATVGAQMPFDRMIRVVDQWACHRGRQDVFAQIGPSAWKPSHIRWVEFMDPISFRQRVAESSAVVAHAGMGSIITALELGKPILVMPRSSRFAETRNDHQLATAQHLLEQRRVRVAFEPEELNSKLDELDEQAAAERLQSKASPELLQALRDFLWRATPDARIGFDGFVIVQYQNSLLRDFTDRLLRQLPASVRVLQIWLGATEAGARGPWSAAKRLARLGFNRSRAVSRCIACTVPLPDGERTSVVREITDFATEAGMRCPLVLAHGPELQTAFATHRPDLRVVGDWKSVLRNMGPLDVDSVLDCLAVSGIDSVSADQPAPSTDVGGRRITGDARRLVPAACDNAAVGSL